MGKEQESIFKNIELMMQYVEALEAELIRLREEVKQLKDEKNN
jgi:hypothetical protein